MASRLGAEHVTAEAIAESFHTLGPDESDRFREMIAAAFNFQVATNRVYRRYCEVLEWPETEGPPPLPVGAFKESVIATFPETEAEHVFLSSATGGAGRSRHYVRSLDVYRRSFETGFLSVFGQGPFTFVAHLPQYAAEGASSSLLYMVDSLVRSFGDEYSGFFLHDLEFLKRAAAYARDAGSPFILFGAAFGLLALLEEEDVPLPTHGVLVETGGMKTTRQEISREDLHRRLSAGFHIPAEQIYSEYGMCELLSQCYTRGSSVFYTPPWMDFAVVDPMDPRRRLEEGEPGALVLFDLANVYTVSSLLTQDRAIGRDGGFEIQGRLQGADLRGCNFLLESLGNQH